MLTGAEAFLILFRVSERDLYWSLSSTEDVVLIPRRQLRPPSSFIAVICGWEIRGVRITKNPKNPDWEERSLGKETEYVEKSLDRGV